MEKFVGDFLNIPTLSKLKCSWHGESMMISLKQFHTFMKVEHDPNCGKEYPRKFNIKKEIGKHVDSVKINGDILFSITALLRYMFHHCNEYKVCRSTVNEIISGLTISTPNRDISMRKELLKSKFQSSGALSLILQKAHKEDSRSDNDDEDEEKYLGCAGRKTVMKKKNKPRKITQDDIPNEDSLDFLSDIVDEDGDFNFIGEYQNGASSQTDQSNDKNIASEQHKNEVENFLNGRYSDKQTSNHSSENGASEDDKEDREDSSPEDNKLHDNHFRVIDAAEPNNIFSSKTSLDQDYQYVLETGEVPRDQYDAYDQFGEACLTCHMCSKRFSTPGNLKTHVRTHTGEKPYYCQFCNKRFTTKGNLDVHVRTHTGERPYKCHFCDKYFSTIGNRQVHMRTHTQERPFSCNLCQKPFSTKANLSTHMKTHSGRRDHECSFCGKAYTTLANLQTHMRSHNPFLQSFLPPVDSPNTSDSEQGPSQTNTLNLGMNNLLPNQNLIGNMNMNLFNPGLFLPMGVPLGMNTFLPPNLMMNKEDSSCLDLSSKEKKESEINKTPKSASTSVLEVNGEKSKKRQQEQDTSSRSKSLKHEVDNSVEIPNGFLPNMAFLNHVNLMNSLAFSVPSQNN